MHGLRLHLHPVTFSKAEGGVEAFVLAAHVPGALIPLTWQRLEEQAVNHLEKLPDWLRDRYQGRGARMYAGRRR